MAEQAQADGFIDGVVAADQEDPLAHDQALGQQVGQPAPGRRVPVQAGQQGRQAVGQVIAEGGAVGEQVESGHGAVTKDAGVLSS